MITVFWVTFLLATDLHLGHLMNLDPTLIIVLLKQLRADVELNSACPVALRGPWSLSNVTEVAFISYSLD